MGSDSDYGVMREAVKILRRAGVPTEVKVVSAHRTPEFMQSYSHEAADRGIKVIIAGAGGAAHLPGMVASLTTVPVIGVPIEKGRMKGLDSLLSVAQMPTGVPVATMAVDNAANAGLLAVRILALSETKYGLWLKKFDRTQKLKVKKANSRLSRRSKR